MLLTRICAEIHAEELKQMLAEKDPSKLHSFANESIAEIISKTEDLENSPEEATQILSYIFSMAAFLEARATYLALVAAKSKNLKITQKDF